jgi:hypothetical protein
MKKAKTYSLKPSNSKVTKNGQTFYKLTTNVGGKVVKRIVTIPER